MRYLLALFLIKGCTGEIQVKPIGIYETRESCEIQQSFLNEYHNSKHFLCVVEDK
jgi:hypothetical protein